MTTFTETSDMLYHSLKLGIKNLCTMEEHRIMTSTVSKLTTNGYLKPKHNNSLIALLNERKPYLAYYDSHR